MHVLGLPPAFVLSQDQTLKFMADQLVSKPARHNQAANHPRRQPAAGRANGQSRRPSQTLRNAQPPRDIASRRRRQLRCASQNGTPKSRAAAHASLPHINNVKEQPAPPHGQPGIRTRSLPVTPPSIRHGTPHSFREGKANPDYTHHRGTVQALMWPSGIRIWQGSASRNDPPCRWAGR